MPSKELKKAKGGARPGAGMPLGYKTRKTIEKEEARAAFRQIVLNEMEELLEAQMAHAKGLKYLVARHKASGKFAKLTEELALKIANGQADEYEAIEVWSKDPSVQAFTDLMNRALDKPKEQEQEIKLSGEVSLIEKLLAGRKRAAETKRT
jgi:hypothetical protein